MLREGADREGGVEDEGELGGSEQKGIDPLVGSVEIYFGHGYFGQVI